MLSNKEIKKLARRQLKENWEVLLIVNFVCIISVLVVGLVTAKSQIGIVNFIVETIMIFFMLTVAKISYNIVFRKKNIISVNLYRKRELVNVLACLILNIIIIHIINGFYVGLVSKLLGMSNVSRYSNDTITSISIILSSKSFIGFIFLIIYILLMFYVQSALIFSYYPLFRANGRVNFVSSIYKSFKIINGHRIEFALFMISFIPFFIVSIMTLGIGFLILNCYYQLAKVHFYRSMVKERYDSLNRKETRRSGKRIKTEK